MHLIVIPALLFQGIFLFFSAGDFDLFSSQGTPYQLWRLEGNPVVASIHNAAVQKMHAYPNPCKDYISVEFQQLVFSVKIFSAVGGEVNANWQQDSNTLIVQTQVLSPGMYRLLINGKESLSIIKE